MQFLKVINYKWERIDFSQKITLVKYLKLNICLMTTLLQQIPQSIVKNHCEPVRSQSENYTSYVKKSQLFKKIIKLRIEVAENP